MYGMLLNLVLLLLFTALLLVVSRLRRPREAFTDDPRSSEVAQRRRLYAAVTEFVVNRYNRPPTATEVYRYAAAASQLLPDGGTPTKRQVQAAVVAAVMSSPPLD